MQQSAQNLTYKDTSAVQGSVRVFDLKLQQCQSIVNITDFGSTMEEFQCKRTRASTPRRENLKIVQQRAFFNVWMARLSLIFSECNLQHEMLGMSSGNE